MNALKVPGANRDNGGREAGGFKKLPAEDSDYGEFAKWIVDGSGEIVLPFGLSMP